MNEYNVYMVVNFDIKEIYKTFLSLIEKTKCGAITIFMHPTLKNTEVEKALIDLSTLNHVHMKIIYLDKKIENIHFGVYYHQKFIHVDDINILEEFLNGKNHDTVEKLQKRMVKN